MHDVMECAVVTAVVPSCLNRDSIQLILSHMKLVIRKLLLSVHTLSRLSSVLDCSPLRGPERVIPYCCSVTTGGVAP
jgi:hypothetical protein